MNILPSEYIADLRDALARVDVKAVERAAVRLDQARRAGRTIFVIGNGGSAATASHFAADLNKLASVGKESCFRAIALGDNIAQLTARANDDGFKTVFALPIQNWAQANDVIFAITTSGESSNIWMALMSGIGVTNIAIVGSPESRCAQLADIAILTPAPRQTQQEDIALAVCHMIAEALR